MITRIGDIVINARVYSEASISSIRTHIEKNGSKYITYPKFIFLCGKGYDKEKLNTYKNSNRGIIQDFINKLLPDAKIVLSEQMWEEGFDENIDLLTFEEFLAEVSDAIILFVESPGSFCELGAFAYANALFSDKLVVVMDEQYRENQSFISTGPVLKAKKDGSKVVYAQIEDGALLASSEIRNVMLELADRIKSKKSTINKRIINDNHKQVYISSFIIEILEVLKIVQPISRTDLLQIYKLIKNYESFTLVKRDGHEFNREIKFGYILKLLQTANIIEEKLSIITLSDHNKLQSFMLKYSGYAMDRERNRIICKKYKYGEYV